MMSAHEHKEFRRLWGLYSIIIVTAGASFGGVVFGVSGLHPFLNYPAFWVLMICLACLGVAAFIAVFFLDILQGRALTADRTTTARQGQYQPQGEQR